MYNLVSRIQDGLGELKKLLETHIHNQGLAAIEKCGEAALNASIPSKQIGATFILEDIKCFLIKLPVCLFSLSLIEFVRTWQFSDVGIRLKTKLASLCFYSLKFWGLWGVFFVFIWVGWVVGVFVLVWFWGGGWVSLWGCALCQNVVLLRKLAVHIQHPTLKQYTWKSTVSRSIICSQLYFISSS